MKLKSLLIATLLGCFAFGCANDDIGVGTAPCEDEAGNTYQHGDEWNDTRPGFECNIVYCEDGNILGQQGECEVPDAA